MGGGAALKCPFDPFSSILCFSSKDDGDPLMAGVRAFIILGLYIFGSLTYNSIKAFSIGDFSLYFAHMQSYGKIFIPFEQRKIVSAVKFVSAFVSASQKLSPGIPHLL